MKQIVPFLLMLCMPLAADAQDIYNRAKSALLAGDTTVAVTGFEEAIRAGQKMADSHYYLGTIALAQGRTDDAVGFLTQSVKENDENIDALKAAGDAYLAKGDAQNGLQYYRKAAKLAPKDPYIAASYGTALLAADSVDAAIVRISSASVLNPENPALYVALGDAYMKQNVTALGITNYRKAIDLEANNVAARFKIAAAYEKDRKWNEAVAAYREIEGIDSTNADAYFGEGAILYKAKQYQNAVPSLTRFVELRPKSFEGTSMLAECLLQTGSPAAVTYAERAVQLDSSSVDTWRMYFYALVSQKQFKEAERALEGLKARGSLKAEDYLKLGSLYFNEGRDDEALSWYLKAIEVDSANCEPYFNIGSLYMRKKDFTNAVSMFEKKIECEPGSLAALLNAGICYLTLKDYPAAREKLTKAVELKPDYDISRVWLGRYYSQVDSLEKAVEQYDEILKLVADNPNKKKEAGEAYFLKGFAYFTKLRFEPAVDAFRKALGYGYETDNLQLMLGQGLLQTLDPKGSQDQNQAITTEALKAFRRCVALNPNNADGHYGVGDALIRSRIVGDDERNNQLKDEACGEFDKALKLNPQHEAAKKSKEIYGCP